jgi:hypothetical protein
MSKENQKENRKRSHTGEQGFLKVQEKREKKTFIGYVKGIKPKPNQGRSK